MAAAQKLFYERGFHAVSIDEIGEAAGVTGPAIYRHFKGKDEILSLLFNDGFEAMLRQLDQVEYTEGDPTDELAALARAHAAYVSEHMELASILIRDNSSLTPVHRRRHQRRERPYIARWIELVKRAYPDRSDEEATTATFGALVLLNSPGNWPASARRAPDLPGLVAEMALGAVRALGARDAAARELQ